MWILTEHHILVASWWSTHALGSTQGKEGALHGPAPLILSSQEVPPAMSVQAWDPLMPLTTSTLAKGSKRLFGRWMDMSTRCSS